MTLRDELPALGIDDVAVPPGVTAVGPPATHPGFWGYVAITAADTVRIYRYLLDRALMPVRRYVMDLLHRPTRYGADGFDQYLGIASVFDPDFSIKQGWSGFRRSTAAM